MICANAKCKNEFVKNSNVQKFCSYQCFLVDRNDRPYFKLYRKAYKQRSYVKKKAREYQNSKYVPREPKMSVCLYCMSEIRLVRPTRYCSKQCKNKMLYMIHSEEKKAASKVYSRTQAGRDVRRRAHKKEKIKNVQLITDNYIKDFFPYKGYKGVIPQEILDVKREQIKLKRKIYEKQRQLNNS